MRLAEKLDWKGLTLKVDRSASSSDHFKPPTHHKRAKWIDLLQALTTLNLLPITNTADLHFVNSLLTIESH